MLRRNLVRIIASLRQWWDQRDEATREILLCIYYAVRNFMRYGARWSAALAYYTIFSIFPLLLLLTIGISRVLGAAVAQEQVANAVAFFLPEALQADLIIETINQALAQDTSFGIIALVGLVWSGLGLFSNVTHSLDQIFQVPEYRSLWRQRLVAVTMILILIVLITTSFITSGVLWLVSSFLLTGGGFSSWVRIATVFLPLGLNMVIYVLVFRFVPARYVYWDAVWPSALVGAIGWELAKAGFSWYLANMADYTLVYGSIAAVIVLLFWAYLLASIFLFSAELCARLNEWYTRHPEEDSLTAGVVQPRLPARSQLSLESERPAQGGPGSV